MNQFECEDTHILKSLSIDLDLLTRAAETYKDARLVGVMEYFIYVEREYGDISTYLSDLINF